MLLRIVLLVGLVSALYGCEDGTFSCATNTLDCGSGCIDPRTTPAYRRTS
jgi:hypothetical protein